MCLWTVICCNVENKAIGVIYVHIIVRLLSTINGQIFTYLQCMHACIYTYVFMYTFIDLHTFSWREIVDHNFLLKTREFER